MKVTGVEPDHWALFEKSDNDKKVLIAYNEHKTQPKTCEIKLPGKKKVFNYFAQAETVVSDDNTFTFDIAPEDYVVFTIENQPIAK